MTSVMDLSVTSPSTEPLRSSGVIWSRFQGRLTVGPSTPTLVAVMDVLDTSTEGQKSLSAFRPPLTERVSSLSGL